jgi:inorganic pyrophosphatase
MDLSQLAACPAPGLVNLIVEIPAGSRNKYEYNAKAGIMALDRVLHSSVRYPFDYGFVPNTLAEDGAPLDAMVIMEEPTFAGCLIAARPIGILDMIDSGAHDGKLLCVPVADPRQAGVSRISRAGSPPSPAGSMPMRCRPCCSAASRRPIRGPSAAGIPRS